MKKKIPYRLLLIPLVFLFLMAFVNAAVTLQTPASSATVSGTSVAWNASFTSFANAMNCSIYVSSASTANSSAVNVSTATNASANPSYINGTFDSNLIEDSNDYSVYASCVNQTSTTQNSTSNTNIVIDNTIPQAGTSLSPANGAIDEDGSVTFSATVTDANTTACTLYFPNKNPGTVSYTMTYSLTSCTHTLSALSDETFDYIIETSDGTNRTNSTTTRFSVDVKTSSGKAALVAQQEGVKPKGGALFEITGGEDKNFLDSGFVTVILIIVGLFFLVTWVNKRK